MFFRNLPCNAVMSGYEVLNPADSTGDRHAGCFADCCGATYSSVRTETCWHHQQVPCQHKYGGAFDFVFILTVWNDAQRDVGDGERGGHHNKA